MHLCVNNQADYFKHLMNLFLYFCFVLPSLFFMYSNIYRRLGIRGDEKKKRGKEQKEDQEENA